METIELNGKEWEIYFRECFEPHLSAFKTHNLVLDRTALFKAVRDKATAKSKRLHVKRLDGDLLYLSEI